MSLPRLSITQILAWADAEFRRTGCWPTENSGPIHEAPQETWMGIDGALTMGQRGLPGHSSLPQLLAQYRGVRNIQRLPRLSLRQVLRWADAVHKRAGRWPTITSGPVEEMPGETWSSINTALLFGRRGLPKSTLAQLLATRRGLRHRLLLPRLTKQQILRWSDEYHDRMGHWPNRRSGTVDPATGETWATISDALYAGSRGLPGRTSLAALLAEHRGVRNKQPIEAAESLPPLALLAEHRGVRNKQALPSLTIRQILVWADAVYCRTGDWPRRDSGPIAEAPGETWDGVSAALTKGLRGLPGGSSLPRLLAARRGIRNRVAPPTLTIKQIVGWADAHYEATGRRPTASSGIIADATDQETWRAIDNALRAGRRGLPGNSSLAQLLDAYRRRLPTRVAPDD